jgi:hypothetical protein
MTPAEIQPNVRARFRYHPSLANPRVTGVIYLEIDLRILREHWNQVRGIRNPPIAPSAAIAAVLYSGHPYVAGYANNLVGYIVGQRRLLGRIQREVIGFTGTSGIDYPVE